MISVTALIEILIVDEISVDQEICLQWYFVEDVASPWPFYVNREVELECLLTRTP